MNETVMYRSMTLVLLGLGMISIGSACNESLCGSIVSKCQLLERCNCEVGVVNTTCSKECIKCLDYLYFECCTCVEICPKRNGSDTKLSSKSHVESLSEPVPHLFETLTEENDTLSRWMVYTRPVQVSFVTGSGSAPKEITFGPGTKVTLKEDGLDQEEDIQINCTVAFMSDCMPFNKCKSSCTSMGASAYRWFHDGCCECVGPNCINYGIEESKCLQCPLKTDNEEEMVIDGPPSKLVPSSKSGGSEDYDGPLSKPAPSSKSEVSEDYEVAPAPTNEEEEKQENNVKKDDTTDEDGHKKSEKNEKLETSTVI